MYVYGTIHVIPVFHHGKPKKFDVSKYLVGTVGILVLVQSHEAMGTSSSIATDQACAWGDSQTTGFKSMWNGEKNGKERSCNWLSKNTSVEVSVVHIETQICQDAARCIWLGCQLDLTFRSGGAHMHSSAAYPLPFGHFVANEHMQAMDT